MCCLFNRILTTNSEDGAKYRSIDSRDLVNAWRGFHRFLAHVARCIRSSISQ